MTRYLAIDPGEKRTGLAAGDDVSGLVSPLHIIEARQGPELDRRLAEAVAAHEPDALVVGLPLNMDGSEGPAAKAVRQFGDRIGRRTGLPVIFHDERLTSYAADQAMAGSGRTHKQKKQRRDALAAAALLESYLAADGGGV